jgi:hypothetical protein
MDTGLHGIIGLGRDGETFCCRPNTRPAGGADLLAPDHGRLSLSTAGRCRTIGGIDRHRRLSRISQVGKSSQRRGNRGGRLDREDWEQRQPDHRSERGAATSLVLVPGVESVRAMGAGPPQRGMTDHSVPLITAQGTVPGGPPDRVQRSQPTEGTSTERPHSPQALEPLSTRTCLICRLGR